MRTSPAPSRVAFRIHCTILLSDALIGRIRLEIHLDLVTCGQGFTKAREGLEVGGKK